MNRENCSIPQNTNKEMRLVLMKDCQNQRNTVKRCSLLIEEKNKRRLGYCYKMAILVGWSNLG